MIPEPGSIASLVVVFPFVLYVCDIVCWKIHVGNVRCLSYIYVEGLYMVEIWL